MKRYCITKDDGRLLVKNRDGAAFVYGVVNGDVMDGAKLVLLSKTSAENPCSNARRVRGRSSRG